MASTNKKRLIQNIILIAVLLSLIFFVWFQKQTADNSNTRSTLYDETIGDSVSEIKIHVEGREDILLKSVGDNWKVVQPMEFDADKEQVRHLFTLFSENADTNYDSKGKDLSKFGLDEDRLSVSFDQVKLIFGEYNPVSQKRYILKGETIYLIEETVTGLLQAGVEAFKLKETDAGMNPN